MGKSWLTVQTIPGIGAALLVILFSLLESVYSNIEQLRIINIVPVLKLQ